MSDDGADMGIGAERALQTVLGGKPSPSRDEGMTPEQMREHLLSAPDKPDTYDDAGRAAGKIILAYLEKHPEDVELSATDEHEWPNGFDKPSVLVTLGIDGAMRQKEPAMRAALSELDLTGFLWGWGVNAAKCALGKPPVPNPAIVTVGGSANA